jgi:hypothetical protein
MFSKLHNRLGTAGLVVAVVALVAALAGTAFAAAGLNSKQKKEVKSIAKTFAGKNGAPGAAGAPGSNGKDGANGKDGTNGTNGTSATTASFAGVKGSCTEGGVEVKSASPAALVCNGKEGSPWTETGSLPTGNTETGTWAVANNGTFPVKTLNTVALSFSIPLGAKIAGGHEHFINSDNKEVVLNESTFVLEEKTSTTCLGTAAAPSAEPGNLCVYAGFLQGASAFGGSFLNPETGVSDPIHNGAAVESALTGAILQLEVQAETAPKAFGTWAVTAS